MKEGGSLIDQVRKLVCDQCKTCEVYAKDENGKKYIIDAGFCVDGTGYIEVNLYDSEKNWIETFRLKDFTDSCELPYNLIIDTEPDCDCL